MSVSCASSAFVLGLLVSGLTSKPARATTPAATFGVSAMVQATCLVSVSAVTFGNYADAMANATTAVSVNCTHSTPYNVSLSASSENSPGLGIRKLATDSALLSYALTSNSQKVVNRASTADIDTVGDAGNGSTQAIAVRGRISGEEHAVADPYLDTITVIIVY